MSTDGYWKRRKEELNRLAHEQGVVALLGRQDSYTLLRRYVRMLVGRKTKGPLDFENTTDDIIKIIFDKEERFEAARGKFTSWVFRITERQLSNAGRKAQRRKTRSLEGIEVPVTNVDPEWTAWWIDFMEQFPDEIDRQILLERSRGLANGEIVAKLGMEAREVASRWSRISGWMDRYRE